MRNRRRVGLTSAGSRNRDAVAAITPLPIHPNARFYFRTITLDCKSDKNQRHRNIQWLSSREPSRERHGRNLNEFSEFPDDDDACNASALDERGDDIEVAIEIERMISKVLSRRRDGCAGVGRNNGNISFAWNIPY